MIVMTSHLHCSRTVIPSD